MTCKHNHLTKLEGPIHPSGKDYRCDDCGEIVEVEIRPAVIGVQFGKPDKEAKAG